MNAEGWLTRRFLLVGLISSCVVFGIFLGIPTSIISNTPDSFILYQADFSNWMGNVEGYIYYPCELAQDSFTDQSHPEMNYGNGTILNVETTMGGPCGQAFIDTGNGIIPYLKSNETRILQLYVYTGGTALSVYETTNFNEYLLNWTNQPVAITPLCGPINTFQGTWINLSIGNAQYLNLQKGTVGDIELGSRESLNAPVLWYIVPRFEVTQTFASIQTDDPRILTLSSSVFISTNLDSEDILNVAINTTCTHQVYVQFIRAGIVQESIGVASGESRIPIGKSMQIDQIAISGLFEGTQHLRVNSLTIIH